MANSKNSTPILWLMGLLFGAVGVATGGYAVSVALEWRAAQQWPEVRAQVLSAELITHPGDADSAETYEVQARYSYSFGDRSYQGERVSLFSGADNLDDFHQRAYQELRQHLDGERSFRCYVNPDDPSQALLYRELRPAMLVFLGVFGLVFGGVGVGLLVGAFYSGRKADSSAAPGLVRGKLAQNFAAVAASGSHSSSSSGTEPWRRYPEWRDGRIASSDHQALWLSLIFAGLWNGMVLPLSPFVIASMLEEGEYGVLALFAVFPLVGLGLLVWAVRALLRWRKFGHCVFLMDPLPASPGGVLGGTLEVPVNLVTERGFELYLSCVRKTVTGSGKNRRVSEFLLWQDSHRLQTELEPWNRERTRLPVLFELPPDAQPTRRDNSDDQIIWRLEASAEVPGVDFHTRFEVPVFPLSQPAAAKPSQVHAFKQLLEPMDWQSSFQRAGLSVEVLSSGALRVVQPRFLNPGAALGSLLFSLVWGGVCVALVYSDAPLWFALVFSLFEALIIWLMLELTLRRRSLELRNDGLVLRSALLGEGEPLSLGAKQIKGVNVNRGMQVGDRLFYRLEITSADKRTHVALGGLPQLRSAQALSARIKQQLKL